MGALLGTIVGLVLGLTGAGGSVFAVPLLMYGLGWSLTQAVPVALIAVCAAAIFGTTIAWNVTHVRYRAAILIGLVGSVTAPLGITLADRLPDKSLLAAFALVLTVVALRLIRQATQRPADAMIVRATVAGEGNVAPGALCRTHGATGRLVWTRACAIVISAIGAMTGVLSGMLGVGGGFVIVPALRSTTTLSMHSAVATSLMAIALISGGTVLTSLAMGHILPWVVAIPFALGSVSGMLIGRKLAPRIAGPHLQQVFGVVMLCAAGSLIAKALA